ncbi:MAG: hypothetical protein ACKO86_22210, partial [Dolichospermum sp.]
DIITPHLTHRELISFKYNINELDKFHYILLNIRYPGWAANIENYLDLIKRLQNNPEYQLKYQKDDVYLFIKNL